MAPTFDRDPSALSALDPSRRAALAELAASSHREPAELLNEAVDAYLDLDRWQRDHIKAGLQAADAGDFASDEEVAAAFARF